MPTDDQLSPSTLTPSPQAALTIQAARWCRWKETESANPSETWCPPCDQSSSKISGPVTVALQNHGGESPHQAQPKYGSQQPERWFASMPSHGRPRLYRCNWSTRSCLPQSGSLILATIWKRELTPSSWESFLKRGPPDLHNLSVSLQVQMRNLRLSFT